MMNDDEVRERIAARMPSCTQEDLEAEQEWSNAVIDMEGANLRMAEHLLKRSSGLRPDLPVREQLSELPGGTWLVARFDHVNVLADVLSSITAAQVGFLGRDDDHPPTP